MNVREVIAHTRMASQSKSKIPTAEKSARIILCLYRDNNLLPGQMLRQLGLEYRFVAGRNGSIEAFKAGMAYAIDHKWIVVNNGQAFLTPKGFDAMQDPRGE